MKFTDVTKDGCPGYKTETILPNGMTAEIVFTYEWFDYDTVEIQIWFCIYRKRKSIKDTIITGDGSLDGLLWARQALLEFEQFATQTFKRAGRISILVYWADKRRKRAYVAGLKGCGYRLVREFNEWVLRKDLTTYREAISIQT